MGTLRRKHVTRWPKHILDLPASIKTLAHGENKVSLRWKTDYVDVRLLEKENSAPALPLFYGSK